MTLKLLRSIEDRCGSARVFEHERLGLAQIMAFGNVLELERHPAQARDERLAYMDQVEHELTKLDAEERARKQSKSRQKKRRIGEYGRRLLRQREAANDHKPKRVFG